MKRDITNDQLLTYCANLPERDFDFARQRIIPDRVAYVVTDGVSISKASLSARTHQLACALKHNNFEVICFLRPGYVHELNAVGERAIGVQEIIDGVRYICSDREGGIRPEDEITEFESNFEFYAELFRVYKPSIVIADGNGKDVLPAYFVARSLGLPFFYDTSHFVENIRQSTSINPLTVFEHKKYESYVIQHASQVFARNDADKSALIDYGIHKNKIQLTAEIPAYLEKNKAFVWNRKFDELAALGPRKQGSVRQLRMACIMDEFTFSSYNPECLLKQLTPDNWKEELESFWPELLFIESAWRGKDELWKSKVGHNSKELQDIISWCRSMKVPTVFWNKEDPVHFETFLNTAKCFDYVFTTDIDCIHRYKAALGHERVYLLPFACQPQVSNPIETYERKDAFCFAGAYYVRYPDRTRDLTNFIADLPSFRPLEIYDRNFGKDDPNYQFPPEYQPYIVGTLPYDQIDKAYKGYQYAINLNSIKQSQSMFARRVYELLGCNTITVSNYSRGVRLLFGDLVVTTDSSGEMVRKLNRLVGSEELVKKHRLLALRKVMQEHTYNQRLSYIYSKAFGKDPECDLPFLAVIAYADGDECFNSIIEQFARQTFVKSRLYVLLATGYRPKYSTVDVRIQLVRIEKMADRRIEDLAGDAVFIVPFFSNDYYGPNYLLDFALATRYSDADVISKQTCFTFVNDDVHTTSSGTSYRQHAGQFAIRRSAIRIERITDQLLAPMVQALGTMAVNSEKGLIIDEFNYCQEGGSVKTWTAVSNRVNDLNDVSTGISIEELLEKAEQITPEIRRYDDAPIMSGKEFAATFSKAPSAKVSMVVEDDVWRIDSTLADGKHEYIYASEKYKLTDLGFTKDVKLYFDASPGLKLQIVVLFLNAKKERMAHSIKDPNRNLEIPIPDGAKYLWFGLRIYSNGYSEIKGLVLGHRNLQPPELIAQSEHLVLTNHYPSYEDLYRNGFVHSRVRAYRDRNIRCDIFKLRDQETLSYHEFEDVDVTTGTPEALHKVLASGKYKSVLVHFLDENMWEVLQQYVDRVRIVVWIHGAEIQPWWRRDYNYRDENERNAAKAKSDVRLAFWRGLLKSVPEKLKLVFVSRYFAEEVMEDLGFRIPEQRYTVIHNPIDTGIFSYAEKTIDQRRKILSIRPYASAKYANDLSVKAIQILSKKPWFKELEFRMIGDGALFDETLAPLRDFSNVHIERGFLKQTEIAALHKEYGIFLCPTRMDAQGVSRDEAMSSGLVPITNGVTAIPEFVDDSCGILAPSEDAIVMADGLAMLYENPEKFLAMSRAAAARVRGQSASDKVINEELDIIGKNIN
jgi:glycosyltransferase involved in cell wall biosynthesis